MLYFFLDFTELRSPLLFLLFNLFTGAAKVLTTFSPLKNDQIALSMQKRNDRQSIKYCLILIYELNLYILCIILKTKTDE